MLTVALPSPSPALLTSYIKKAWTLEALFRTYCTHKGRFNHIHLSACWSALGKLATGNAAALQQRHASALESLVQHTTQAVATSAQIRARELANIAHGAAKSGRACSMDALMQALAASITQRVSEANAQELANTAWAFAKAGQLDAQLSEALARAAERRIDEFKAQEISNIAWAYATAGCSDALLFKALARAAEQHLESFSAQGIANTAWAFAKAGHVDSQLFSAMAKVAQRTAYAFNATDLAHTLWVCPQGQRGPSWKPSPSLSPIGVRTPTTC
tara:strand:+ start:56 stop:880 length:825 start_codon:yes stop_codon:yes gene_type:complete